MQRKNVIILIDQEQKEPICRGNFKKLCEEFSLPYHSLKMKPFPIQFEKVIIHRVLFK